MSCPLCDSLDIQDAGEDPLLRELYLCNSCKLIHVDRKYLMPLDAQKLRYDFHQNEPTPGYIRFLNQCIVPTLDFLSKPHFQRGIDYGSGPGSESNGSVLAQILSDHGYSVESYDPIYSPVVSFRNSTSMFLYDFLFSTEVWEHFTEPIRPLTEINSIVRPGGILSIMTSPWDESTVMSQWHYAKDDTHVMFYHKNTMEWIASRFEWELLLRPIPSVWIFRKKELK